MRYFQVSANNNTFSVSKRRIYPKTSLPFCFESVIDSLPARWSAVRSVGADACWFVIVILLATRNDIRALAEFQQCPKGWTEGFPMSPKLGD